MVDVKHGLQVVNFDLSEQDTSDLVAILTAGDAGGTSMRLA